MSAFSTQHDVVAWLMDPATHGGQRVERIDTHSASVFLAGDRALKLKRAVRFDYIDFSTLDRRRAACEAELRINQPNAPAIYRDVVRITREADGSLAFDGHGDTVEWLVGMNRFDQADLLDRRAADGRLDLALMRPLASAIVRFHRQAPQRLDHGGYAGMRWVIDGNAAGFAEQGRGILAPQACAELTTRSQAELGRHRDLLERRREGGLVRQCHGDLHLRNIVLIDGRPTLFDAVEFNDAISCTDVLYDLAFLLMDLWRRELPRHANTIFNAYLLETTELDGLPLLPLFLSCRAAVRAKTSATAARVQSDEARRRELEHLAREYLAMAGRLLNRPAHRLVAVGGLSGSGKSSVARALAPDFGSVPGALVLRSDEIRKALCGVSSLDRLGPDAYTPEMSARVYAVVRERTAVGLAAGCSVIADAVYNRAEDRVAIEQVAAAAGVPFTGLWLDAPAEVLVARVDRREADASDADAAVVRRQLTRDPGPLAWARIDASGTLDAVVREARERSMAPPDRTHST